MILALAQRDQLPEGAGPGEALANMAGYFFSTEPVTSVVISWVLVCCLLGMLGGAQVPLALNLWLLQRAVYAVLWVAWAPVRLIGRATGTAVPVLAFAGLARLFGPRVPHVHTPEDEIEARTTVDPRKALKIAELPHGYLWTPVGLVEAVSMALVAESGGAKGQTLLNYALQAHMLHSREHMIVLEIKPNLEQSNIVYAHMKPGDRLFEYSFQSKDVASSALALFNDSDALADIAQALCADATAGDGAHWNDKSAELIEVASLALGRKLSTVSGMAQLPQVADVVADRSKLDALRQEYPALDYVADTPGEFGGIRSSAKKRLKPLSSSVTRRVFAAGAPGIEQPDFSRTDGRDIVIVRPDWSSLRRTNRFITSLIHALVMSAVNGGYGGGPGTKVYLDEMGSAMKPTYLGEYLDMARGGLINIMYILQNRPQLAAQLDRDEADRIWKSTEAKIVGPSSDLQLADETAKLSGRARVHYPGPRQHDELIASKREDVRQSVSPEEITRQKKGEFTLVHRGRVLKYAVPRKCWYYLHAAPPPVERPCPLGVADPAAYAAPSLFADAGEDPDHNDGRGAAPDDLEDY